MHDLVIVGGGAASQAAAMYAQGKQIDYLMICDRVGGRVEPMEAADFDYAVGNILVHFDHPDAEDEERKLIGSSAVRLFERQLVRQQGRLLNDQVVSVERSGHQFVIKTRHVPQILSRTVIIATGATPRRLDGVRGAELVRGLGHGTTSRASDVAGKVVAVIGGSEQALYSAADLSCQARQLYLVLQQEPMGDNLEVSLVQRRPNIEVLAGYRLVAVYGEDAASRLVLDQNGSQLTLEVDCAFADLGSEPASALVRHIARTSSEGFIQVDRGCATTVPGLYAAGDVTQLEGEHVLAAIGDGARAARSAHFYLLTRPMAVAVSQGR